MFRLALGTLKDNYVEPLDEEALTATALKAMLNSLDSHSSYMTATEFTDFQTNMSGKIGGIGVILDANAEAIRVVSPVGGAPAARAGVETGWTLRDVSGIDVGRKPLADVVRMLRGKPGEPVAVTFLDTSGRAVALKLLREEIQLQSVFRKRLGAVGYLRINGFTATTNTELGTALDEMARPGQLTGLVLDLRSNTGGYVDSAVAAATRFLEPGTVVVRSGRNLAAAKSIAASDSPSKWRTIPIVVLVNGGTASAAEIVAGALQDNGRARIIGLTTFGKGLVQTIFPVQGGTVGAFSITNQRYYTPKGHSIQQTGIVPDLMVARTAAEAKAAVETLAFSEASLAHALSNEEKLQRKAIDEVEAPAESEQTAPPPPLFREPVPSDADVGADFQLRRALDLLSPAMPPFGPLPRMQTYRRRAPAPAPAGSAG